MLDINPDQIKTLRDRCFTLLLIVAHGVGWITAAIAAILAAPKEQVAATLETPADAHLLSDKPESLQRAH
jgi:hypothetical protein